MNIPLICKDEIETLKVAGFMSIFLLPVAAVVLWPLFT